MRHVYPLTFALEERSPSETPSADSSSQPPCPSRRGRSHPEVLRSRPAIAPPLHGPPASGQSCPWPGALSSHIHTRTQAASAQVSLLVSQVANSSPLLFGLSTSPHIFVLSRASASSLVTRAASLDQATHASAGHLFSIPPSEPSRKMSRSDHRSQHRV